MIECMFNTERYCKKAEILNEWNTGAIMPTYKKEDRKDCVNYRYCNNEYISKEASNRSREPKYVQNFIFLIKQLEES